MILYRSTRSIKKHKFNALLFSLNPDTIIQYQRNSNPLILTGSVLQIIDKYCDRISSKSARWSRGQYFVLAVLHPSVPCHEAHRVVDLLSASNIILNIVVGNKVLALFIADTTSTSTCTPFHTIDLKDSITVARFCFRPRHKSCIKPTFVLYEANPIAVKTSGYTGAFKF